MTKKRTPGTPFGQETVSVFSLMEEIRALNQNIVAMRKAAAAKWKQVNAIISPKLK